MTQPPADLPHDITTLLIAHASDSADFSRDSLHHTLGVAPTQASPGSHTHLGDNASKGINQLTVGTSKVTWDGTTLIVPGTVRSTAGHFESRGSVGGFNFADRANNAQQWEWYANQIAGVTNARLYSSVVNTDILNIGSDGGANFNDPAFVNIAGATASNSGGFAAALNVRTPGGSTGRSPLLIQGLIGQVGNLTEWQVGTLLVNRVRATDVSTVYGLVAGWDVSTDTSWGGGKYVDDNNDVWYKIVDGIAIASGDIRCNVAHPTAGPIIITAPFDHTGSTENPTGRTDIGKRVGIWTWQPINNTVSQSWGFINTTAVAKQFDCVTPTGARASGTVGQFDKLHFEMMVAVP